MYCDILTHKIAHKIVCVKLECAIYVSISSTTLIGHKSCTIGVGYCLFE